MVVIKELLKKEDYIIMSDYLKHYGILGMKWGVRRYQNKDGSLTPEGKRRYRATSSDSATTKRTPTSRNRKTIKVGASIVAGLLSGSFGAGGIYALTGSQTAAEILGPALGVIGGMKYYEWINS